MCKPKASVVREKSNLLLKIKLKIASLACGPVVSKMEWSNKSYWPLVCGLAWNQTLPKYNYSDV